MRPALLASLILIGLIAVGMRSTTFPHPYVPVRPNRPAEASTEGKNRSWTVQSRLMKDPEDAERDALLEAQVCVSAYLRTLNPPLQWIPPADYVQKRLVKKRAEKPEDFEGEVGVMRRVELEVEVTPRTVREMVRLDREDRSHQRMLWLAKILAVAVALLAALAGYVQLDERTKGYYTTFLRLGAAGIVGAVGAGLWLLC